VDADAADQKGGWGAIISPVISVQDAPPDDELERKVDRLMWESALSIPLLLLRIGFFLGIYAYAKGRKLLKKIKGRSDENRLRKRIKLELWLSGIAWGLPVLVAIVGIVTIVKLFADLSNM